MDQFVQTFKLYYSYLAKNKLVFGLFLVVSVGTITATSITPYFYKLFVDAIPDLNFDELLKILLWYMGVRIGGSVLSGLRYELGDYMLINGTSALRSDVVKQIHDLDFAYHSSKSTGSLISKIKRGDNAFWGLSDSIHHNMLTAIGGMVIMFILLRNAGWQINLVLLVAFALGLLVTRFVVKHNLKNRIAHNASEDELSAIVTDNMINYETVKYFAQENAEQKRLDKRFAVWKKILWRYVHSFRIMDLSVDTVVALGIFAVFALALHQASLSQITTGDFVLIAGLINTVFPQLYTVVWTSRSIAKDYTDIEKYLEILTLTPEIKDPEKPIHLDKVAGEIKFKNVWFKYVEKGSRKKAKAAIRGLSLHIRQGQSVALVGRSGSGKTTLTKLLMRFYDVDSGSITVDGVNIKNFTKSNLRSLMGVVPQEPVLFNNTIGYNIGYGRTGASQKEIEAAAKMANLHEFIVSLPRGYKTNVGERGIKLSGGQKQRLAIARMLLADPHIIIFDEATSQLDSENEKLIQDAFWSASADKTTLIIAHRLSTAMRADKIVVMENGKIVESGSHVELLAKPDGLYRYVWGLQTAVDS